MPHPTLRPARTVGERSIKVDHAGEHGAISIYRAQRWIATWRAPDIVSELDHFLQHERRHRTLFASELDRRGIRRCRSFHLCGLGGLTLGLLTGLLGARAIALTTEAVESVVLKHLSEQLAFLKEEDPDAAAVIDQIVVDEQEHHHRSAQRLTVELTSDGALRTVIRGATEAVIWLGMRQRLPASAGIENDASRTT